MKCTYMDYAHRDVRAVIHNCIHTVFTLLLYNFNIYTLLYSGSFASLAMELLEHCYSTDDDLTQQLLTYELENWSDQVSNRV